MDALTQTIVCHDCRKLYDVYTGSREFPRSSEKAPLKLTCRQDASHRISVWNHPGPCPVCGTVLKRGLQTAIWD